MQSSALDYATLPMARRCCGRCPLFARKFGEGSPEAAKKAVLAMLQLDEKRQQDVQRAACSEVPTSSNKEGKLVPGTDNGIRPTDGQPGGRGGKLCIASAC